MKHKWDNMEDEPTLEQCVNCKAIRENGIWFLGDECE